MWMNYPLLRVLHGEEVPRGAVPQCAFAVDLDQVRGRYTLLFVGLLLFLSKIFCHLVVRIENLHFK